MKETPHSEPYEKSALALILQHPETAGAVLRSSLSPDSFYIAANRQLFDAIREHHQDGEIAILDKAMRQRAFMAAGGAEYFDKLRHTPISDKKREEVQAKLSELLCCRKLIESCPKIVEAAYSGEYQSANGVVSSMLDELSKTVRHEEQGASVKECLQSVIEEMGEMQNGKSICRPVGLTQLDNYTGGVIDEFILIAGPTSSGKSALSLEYMLANCVDHQRPGVVFSYEMNRKVITKRMIARISGVSLGKLMGISPDGGPVKFRKDELVAVRTAVEKLSECKLFIEDDVTRTVEDVWSRCSELKAVHGDMGCVVVDYLQIANPSHQTSKDNRERQISHMGIKLKQLSQHLNCCVVGLSQLGPDFGTRESRALEQHAGTLLKVIRGENHQGQRIEDEKIQIWKNRRGPRFIDIKIGFDGERQKFYER